MSSVCKFGSRNCCNIFIFHDLFVAANISKCKEPYTRYNRVSEVKSLTMGERAFGGSAEFDMLFFGRAAILGGLPGIR